MATDAGDHKRNTSYEIEGDLVTDLCLNATRDLVTDLCLNATRDLVTEQWENLMITFEHGDRHTLPVRPKVTRDQDKKYMKKMIRKKSREEIENVKNEYSRLLVTCSVPQFQLQSMSFLKPFWYSVVGKGQASAVLHILVCQDDAQFERQKLSLMDSRVVVYEKMRETRVTKSSIEFGESREPHKGSHMRTTDQGEMWYQPWHEDRLRSSDSPLQTSCPNQLDQLFVQISLPRLSFQDEPTVSMCSRDSYLSLQLSCMDTGMTFTEMITCKSLNHTYQNNTALAETTIYPTLTNAQEINRFQRMNVSVEETSSISENECNKIMHATDKIPRWSRNDYFRGKENFPRSSYCANTRKRKISRENHDICRSINNKRCSGNENNNAGDDSNEEDSSDSEVDCAYYDDDESSKSTHEGRMNFGDLAATGQFEDVNILEQEETEHLTEHLESTALDNSSNSFAAEIEIDTKSHGTVMHECPRPCQFVNKYTPFMHVVDSLDVNEICLATCDDANKTTETTTGEKHSDLIIGNEQLFELHQKTCLDRSIVLSPGPQYIKQNKHALSSVETSCSAAAGSNDPHGPEGMDNKKMLKRNVYSVSSVQQQKSCEQRHDRPGTPQTHFLSGVSEEAKKFSPSGGNIDSQPSQKERCKETSSTPIEACMKDETSSDDLTNVHTHPSKISRRFNAELVSQVVEEDTNDVTKKPKSDLECIHFLSILTTKLEEYSNTHTIVSNQNTVTTSAGRNQKNNSDSGMTELFLANTVSHPSNESDVLYGTECRNQRSSSRDISNDLLHVTECKNQRSSSREKSPNLQRNEHANVKTLAKDDGANTVYSVSRRAIDVISKNQSGYFVVVQDEENEIPKAEVHSSVNQAMFHEATWEDSRPVSVEDVSLQSHLLSQEQAHNSSLCELSLACKDWQTASTDSLSEVTKFFPGGTNHQQKNQYFEVDVFKTMEYASSLSCGQSNEHCHREAVVSCEQSTLNDIYHNSRPAQSKINQMSCSNNESYIPLSDGQAAPRQECSNVSRACSQTNKKTFAQGSEEECASYSRARIMRASQRRRKLMTEFEEITSCADVYNWSRHDNKNYPYELRNLYHDFDYAFNGQVTDLESTCQSEDQHVIGTLTIEYLNPPVNGLVFLN